MLACPLRDSWPLASLCLGHWPWSLPHTTASATGLTFQPSADGSGLWAGYRLVSSGTSRADLSRCQRRECPCTWWAPGTVPSIKRYSIESP